MGMRERLIVWGNFLFRWRSYTPLILLPLMVPERDIFLFPPEWAILESGYIGACLAFSLIGEIMRILTVGSTPSGTSGRNTKTQAANVLNTTGIYSIVRNPLYLGNYLIFMGITLLLQSWAIPIIFTLVFAIVYICIILAEEDFLLNKYGETFVEFQERVPAFIPKISLWNSIDRVWSWRRALRREHDTILSIALYLVFIEYLRSNLIAEVEFDLRLLWLVGGIIGLNIIIKLVVKLTSLLD